MCTALSFKTKYHYFGRNLDLEYNYNESVTITPREFCFNFVNGECLEKHFAIIGMATVADNYPLYYDATNEHGLSVAALNFPGNAVYNNKMNGKYNISPFEFIPWVLCKCKSVKEFKEITHEMNLISVPFSDKYPLTPLHWVVSDKAESIVIEQTSRGFQSFENPVGVLTNNPTFDFHLNNLNNYMNVTPCEAQNRFSDKINLESYSRGMGGIGLPGDLSSVSRFVRAAFVKLNSVCSDDENSSISCFFHILTSVEQQKGCVKVNDGYEITVYSSCCNTDKCIYYYTTYENRQISAVHLFNCDLNTSELISYPLLTKQKINYIN